MARGGQRDGFEEFFSRAEPRLRQALCATLGSDAGREATVDALTYAWRRWDKVRVAADPVAYLYVIGRNRGRRQRRAGPVRLAVPDDHRLPWVEPALPAALARLSEQQRVVVMLLFCFEWTMSEVASALGIAKSTVQTHSERGLAALRDALGVTL